MQTCKYYVCTFWNHLKFSLLTEDGRLGLSYARPQSVYIKAVFYNSKSVVRVLKCIPNPCYEVRSIVILVPGL